MFDGLLSNCTMFVIMSKKSSKAQVNSSVNDQIDNEFTDEWDKIGIGRTDLSNLWCTEIDKYIHEILINIKNITKKNQIKIWNTD